MELTGAIALYVSVIVVLLVLFLIFQINKIKRFLGIIDQEFEEVKEDLDVLKNAQKEVVHNVVSPESAHRIFTKDEKFNKKEAKRQARKKRYVKTIATIETGIDRADRTIGQQLLDKAGVISVLIGLVYMVGLGVEYNWINSIGRVFFGVVIAGVLLIMGYFLRNKYMVFSSVLFGGGLASLIFTLFAAFYRYHIISMPLSYGLVILIVVIAVMLAVITDRKEIAALTFAAGYLAPFTVSFTEADYWAVFTYLIVLNVGVIVYDYFRKSLFINLISYAFTFILYAFWMITQFLGIEEDVPFAGAMIFLSIFYIMIFFIILLNNIRENRKILPIEFSLLVTATAMYYTAGIIIINKAGVDYRGIFTAWIAIVNYSYFLFLYPKRNFDRRILNLFLGLTIMFSALVVPVEFLGKSPTLVWALQAILLMFISLRADLKGMKLGSIELTVAMLGSLAFDLYDQYLSTTGDIQAITPIFNKGFLSSMLAVFSLFTNAYLLKFEKNDFFGMRFIRTKLYQLFLIVSGFIAFYVAVRLEIKYAVVQLYDYQPIIKSYLALLNYGLLALLAAPALFIKKKEVAYGAIIAFVIAFAIYLIDYSYSWAELRNAALLSPYINLGQFKFHYWGALLLAIISVSAIAALPKLFPKANIRAYLATLGVTLLIVVFISNELDNYWIVKYYQPHLLIQELLQKIYRLHYSIGWAVYALVLIIWGILSKYKPLRFSGITLFALTTIKVFAYDMPKLSSEDLTLLFIVYGAVLLASSFVFQIHYRTRTEA